MVSFGLAMDVGILVLLAATVFLAFRLNINLKNFKESRSEMEGLVNRLTANIDKAERAIGGMQNAARNAGKELDEVISDAKALSGELKFMNETGNNLANRLEKIAERNRANAVNIEDNQSVGQSSLPSKGQPIRIDEGHRGFAIQDRDFGAVVEEEEDEFEDLNDDDFSVSGGRLQSQAERELFEALQKGKPRRMA